MPNATHYVRLPPMCPTRLLDHLSRLEQQRLGDREAQRLGGLHIDHEFERHRLLYWEIPGLAPLRILGYTQHFCKNYC
jgi:hypothetical protein